MAIISWTDNYAVEIEKIDNQHKTLIEYINTLNDALLRRKGNDTLEDILEKLTVYTVNHFRTEESYMISYSYGDFDIHRKEHRAFIRQIEDFRHKYKDCHGTLNIELVIYLKQWFLKHIAGSDKSLGQFLKKSGV